MNKKAIYSYLVAFLLLITVIIIDRRAFNEMQRYVRSVDHTREVIIALEKVSDHFKSAQIYTPTYTNLVNHDMYILYKQETEQLQTEIPRLKQLVSDNNEQMERIDSIAALINKHYSVLKTKNIAEIVQSGETWRLGDLFRVHALINTSVKHEEGLLRMREQELARSSKLTSTLTVAFSIIAAGLILFTFVSNLFLTRKRKWLEGFLESILDTSQGGIVMYKAVRRKGKLTDFKIEFANKIIGNLLGIEASTVIGKKLSELPSYVRDGHLLAKFRHIVETGKQDAFETYYDQNNIQRWFYVLLVKLDDGLIANFHDISELKRSQEELKNNITKLEESNAELEQYAYAASHDLQEPLRKIRLYTSHLQRQMNRLDETGQRDIEKILSSAERMSNLINDLLGLSSVKKEAAFTQTDLNQILKNVLEDLDLLIIQQKAIIKAAPLPVIEAMSLQMNQLFYNLLNNALKFASKDRQLIISIGCRELTAEDIKAHPRLNAHTKYIEITVADNGIGFSEEYAEQIFGLFKRLGDKQHYPGSGIGLALCRKVADNHNGIIYAQGKEMQGATFHIILPVSQTTI